MGVAYTSKKIKLKHSSADISPSAAEFARDNFPDVEFGTFGPTKEPIIDFARNLYGKTGRN